MIENKQNNTTEATTLAQIVAKTCFCKLREFCNDKNSKQCLRSKNIYAEFIAEKRK